MFGRRRSRKDGPEEDPDAGADTAPDTTPDTAPEGSPASSAPDQRARVDGPWDVAEVADPAAGGRIDLGGIWLPGRPNLEVRVEADQSSGNIVGVTLVLGDGALQVAPYAAPRSEGIWAEVLAEIRGGVTKQGGTADEVTGPFGPELRTRVPVRASDGSAGVQSARFIGVDGPRWFLRGVITGRPAAGAGADEALLSLFRDIVVVRGSAAMAPRDPIPLRLPVAPADGSDDAGDDASEDDQAAAAPDLAPFERGPEITEIR